MTSPHQHSKPVRLAHDALLAAQSGNWTKATRTVERISNECGGEGLQVALITWCDAARDHATDGQPNRPAEKVTFYRTDNGQSDGADSQRLPTEVRWAGNLLGARAAMDEDRWTALVEELPEDGAEIGRHFVAVLNVVSSTINGLPRGYVDMERNALAEPPAPRPCRPRPDGPKPPPKLLEAVTDTLTYAACQDMDRLTEALDVIFDAGDQALYAACTAWAESVKLLNNLGGPGFVSIEFGPEDEPVAPEDVSPDARSTVWAARFAAAHCNGDSDTTLALFEESDPERMADNMLSLLALAASAIRAKSEGDES